MTGIALVLIPINTGLQAGVCMVPDASSRLNGFASVAECRLCEAVETAGYRAPFRAPGSSQVLMKGRLAAEDQFDSRN